MTTASPGRAGIAHAAAAWSLIFCAVHAYWALGGRAGLPAGLVMAEEPMLLAVDILAVPACLAGAALALTLARRRSPLLIGAAAIVAGFCLFHALPTLATGLAMLFAGGDPAPGERARLALYLYEPWWLLGGFLYAAAAWRAAANPDR